MDIQRTFTSNLKWGDCKKYKDAGYIYTTCQLQSDKDNLCYKMTCHDRKALYITIKDYKRYTAVDIMNIFIEIGWDSRHVTDALLEFYKRNGLDLGFTKKILRSI